MAKVGIKHQSINQSIINLKKNGFENLHVRS
jgi:hypothetical protein